MLLDLIWHAPLSAGATYAYEIFFGTATNTLELRLSANSPTGTTVDITTFGIISSGGATHNNTTSVGFSIADNNSTAHTRLFYIKPLNTRSSSGGIERVALSHPATNISNVTLLPIYTI